MKMKQCVGGKHSQGEERACASYHVVDWCSMFGYFSFQGNLTVPLPKLEVAYKKGS